MYPPPLEAIHRSSEHSEVFSRHDVGADLSLQQISYIIILERSFSDQNPALELRPSPINFKSPTRYARVIFNPLPLLISVQLLLYRARQRLRRYVCALRRVELAHTGPLRLAQRAAQLLGKPRLQAVVVEHVAAARHAARAGEGLGTDDAVGVLARHDRVRWSSML